MFSFLRNLLSPPIFVQDEDKTRVAAILSPLLSGTIILLTILTLAQGFTGANSYRTLTTGILAGLILVSIGLWILARRGYARSAAYIYSTLGWIALTYLAWADRGFRDTAIIGYIVIILASSLLLGWWSSIGYLVISLISTWVFAYLETIGRYSGVGDAPYRAAITLSIFFMLDAVISILAVNNINRSLRVSRTSEQELRIKNEQLLALQLDLEKRVSELTNDLERSSSEIRTASLIARDTSTAPDVESLLDRAAELIKDKFGYYHTGIYLNDDKGEYTVLKAAGGDAGHLMMKRKYKVLIGEPGIIGYVAQSGDPRIILDVASEPIFNKNPLLPYTRSEMALPLKVTNRLIGVLDIQSDKINAFDHNSISIMQIVTDQISINVERSQLLEGLQINAAALQQALQENTSRTWKQFLEYNRGSTGFKYDGIAIESISELPEQKQMHDETGLAKSSKGKSAQVGNYLSVPIQLRGQTLGTLNLQFQTPDVSPDTLRHVEESANRLALALENARLVQDAQRLAARERQINVISAQVQQSTNLDMLLQNTVRELGNTLGMPKTFIQIGLVNSGLKNDQ